MPAYPATLPLPSWSLGAVVSSPKAITDMDAGLPRQRLTGSVEIQTYNFRFQFTSAQLQTFKAFWRTDLQLGSLFFTITLPDSGADMVNMDVRPMGTDYGCTFVNFDTWEVTFTVGRQIVQDIAEPTSSPVPVWYRPEIVLTGDIVLDPVAHRNALFSASPGPGAHYTITVPAIASPSNIVPFGVRLDSTGSIVVLTNGEVIGGISGMRIKKPAYLANCYDGFVSQPNTWGTQWTTTTGNPETGRVTTWPSFKGLFQNLAATDNSAGQNDVIRMFTPLKQCVCAKGDWRISTTGFIGFPASVMVVFRAFYDTQQNNSSRDFGYLRFHGDKDSAAGAFRGLFMAPATGSPLGTTGNTIHWQNGSGTQSYAWNDANGKVGPSDRDLLLLSGANGSRDQWNALMIVMATAGGTPELFLNGVKLTRTNTGTAADVLTRPFNGLGFSTISSLDVQDHYAIGDWTYYNSALSDATAIAYTLEAFNRFNYGESYETY